MVFQNLNLRADLLKLMLVIIEKNNFQKLPCSMFVGHLINFSCEKTSSIALQKYVKFL